MQDLMCFKYQKYRDSGMVTKGAAADSSSTMARAILTLHYVLVTVYLKIIKTSHFCLKFTCWKNCFC